MSNKLKSKHYTAWKESSFRISPYASAFGLNTEKYLSLFNPNEGIYGPEKLQIRIFDAVLNSKDKLVRAMDKVNQNINRWRKENQHWFDKIRDVSNYKDVSNLKDYVIKDDKKAI